MSIPARAFYLSPFPLLFLLVLVDSRTHPGDIRVLLDLRNGLHLTSLPAGSCLSSWDFSLDPCDHVFGDRFTCGFRCSRVISGLSRVTEITLDPAGYSGSLSSSTWNLPYLQILDVSDNFFSGQIPDSFSNLTRLSRLSLSENSLSGSIPSSLGTLSRLEELILDNNRLSGPIPSTFNRLTSLKRLELQQNNLTGAIPDLRSLRNLHFIDASDNQISGEIPAALPPSLIEISIRNNNLEGNVPRNVGDLRFLQVLDLSHNKLSGPVVSVLFNHRSMQQVTLSHNNFTSFEVSGNTGMNSWLIALDLSHNQIRGLLPAFMASMPKLSALSLEYNKFTGMIPSQYALKAVIPEPGTSSFKLLLLGGNYLFGSIPDPLMGLTPDSANVSLVDNCLYRCPSMLFFCQGMGQKSLLDCKTFGPIIP